MGLRELRRKPGFRHAWKVVVFLLGLALIAGGLALAVLPGPLTIPPVLLGLWLWSTEFGWAHRFFHAFRERGEEAWAAARRHPVRTTIATVVGLALAAVAIWATLRYDLVSRGQELIGLG